MRIKMTTWNEEERPKTRQDMTNNALVSRRSMTPNVLESVFGDECYRLHLCMYR